MVTIDTLVIKSKKTSGKGNKTVQSGNNGNKIVTMVRKRYSDRVAMVPK